MRKERRSRGPGDVTLGLGWGLAQGVGGGSSPAHTALSQPCPGAGLHSGSPVSSVDWPRAVPCPLHPARPARPRAWCHRAAPTAGTAVATAALTDLSRTAEACRVCPCGTNARTDAVHATPDQVSLFIAMLKRELGGSSLPTEGQFGSTLFGLRVFSVCKHQTPGW